MPSALETCISSGTLCGLKRLFVSPRLKYSSFTTWLCYVNEDAHAPLFCSADGEGRVDHYIWYTPPLLTCNRFGTSVPSTFVCLLIAIPRPRKRENKEASRGAIWDLAHIIAHH